MPNLQLSLYVAESEVDVEVNGLEYWGYFEHELWYLVIESLTYHSLPHVSHAELNYSEPGKGMELNYSEPEKGMELKYFVSEQCTALFCLWKSFGLFHHFLFLF